MGWFSSALKMGLCSACCLNRSHTGRLEAEGSLGGIFREITARSEEDSCAEPDTVEAMAAVTKPLKDNVRLTSGCDDFGIILQYNN